MACTLTLAGRGVGCKDALGGIKRIYVAEWVDGIWEDIASGEVSGSTAAITFYTYDMTRGSGSLNQTITSDLAAGTVFFDQVCSVTFNKAATADITEISNLVKGRMAVLVEDNNGNWAISAWGGRWTDGAQACSQLGGSYHFAAPTNSKANEALKAVKGGMSHVWLNASDRAQEGKWVAN